MKVIQTKWVGLFNAGAITIFPFIFIDPIFKEGSFQYLSTFKHEMVHYNQQKHWALYGLGVGLLVWYALYLLALPVGWNPFRKKWEMEAYRAQGFSEAHINEIMKQSPYYL